MDILSLLQILFGLILLHTGYFSIPTALSVARIIPLIYNVVQFPIMRSRNERTLSTMRNYGRKERCHEHSSVSLVCREMKAITARNVTVDDDDLKQSNQAILKSMLGLIDAEDFSEFLKNYMSIYSEFEGMQTYRQTLIHFAVAVGSDELLDLALEQDDIDINAQDVFGFTALHYAARMGFLEIAKRLIEYGAGVCVKDDVGHTPAFYALQNDCEVADEMLELLNDAAEMQSKEAGRLVEEYMSEECKSDAHSEEEDS